MAKAAEKTSAKPDEKPAPAAAPAPDRALSQSGWIAVGACVLGGWGNTISIIGRLDEHGADRKERRDKKVEIKRTYHMRVERLGTSLRWFVDNDLFMTFDDPQPLEGSGHDRFGFSSWEAELIFANLNIE